MAEVQVIVCFLGLLIFFDGAISLGWYKEDLERERHAVVRTFFRVMRLFIGGGLVLFLAKLL
ncbi:hypothetical protein ES703_30700 [subsurface metagenome]|nr:hypothetical protein [bacterium]